MEISLNIKNENIANKILWMLEHFKNEIEIKIENNFILNDIKQGLQEIKEIKNGKDNSRPVEELLNEL